MKLGIMQPYFFAYMGHYQLINTVDEFIIYDNIKYTKKGWINRNKILVNKFYNFYGYLSGIDGTIVDGIIDFTNPQTTVSFDSPLSSLEGPGKIFDILITDTLFSSLSLFE